MAAHASSANHKIRTAQGVRVGILIGNEMLGRGEIVSEAIKLAKQKACSGPKSASFESAIRPHSCEQPAEFPTLSTIL